MLLLLIIGGVEVNPGLSSSLNLTFGMLNTRSMVNKAPLLHSIITDNDLSILAITETWVKSDDPPVIMNGPAPSGYRILHVHCDNPDQSRGSGLAVIHRDTINVQLRKHKKNHSLFEHQLVNTTLQSRDIVLANIYLHLLQAYHCSLRSSTCSLPIWEWMQLIVSLFVATSTYQAPHPTWLITGWPSPSTQLPVKSPNQTRFAPWTIIFAWSHHHPILVKAYPTDFCR